MKTKNLFILILVILAVILTACTKVQPASNLQTSKDSENGFIKPIQTIGDYYKVKNDPALLDGKPVVLFVGAQFCPFCATQRWSTVDALSRFGTFSGLGKMKSSESDNDEGSVGGIATYDFMNATYTSDYITFDAKEIADVNGQPLQELNDFEKQFVDKFNPRGSIPFQLIAGKYVRIGPSFNPSVLQGKTFDELKTAVSDPNSEIGQKIKREADVITALICSTTNDQPANTCNDPKVKAWRDQINE